MSRVEPSNEETMAEQLKTAKIFPDKNDLLELKLMLFILRHKKVSRYVHALLMFLHVLGFFYCAWGKLQIYYQLKEFNNDIVAFVNALSDFLLLAVNIIGMTSLRRTAFFVELIAFTANNNTMKEKETHKNFMRYLQTLRMVPIIPIITSVGILGSQIGWNILQYFVLRDIWNYFLNLVACSAMCLADRIKHKFIEINDNLERLSEHESVAFITVDVPQGENHLYKISTKHDYMMEITNNYTILCDLLDKFNRYGKFHLVLVIMCITMNFLYNITVVIEFTAKPKHINGNNPKTMILILQSMLAITTMGQAAGAAYVGETLEEEGNRTTRICYSFLNKLNRKVKTDDDSVMLNQLNFLLDQSKSRKIYLHAGGFFKLNWGILGSITSTVATYSIVIIQFLK